MPQPMAIARAFSAATASLADAWSIKASPLSRASLGNRGFKNRERKGKQFRSRRRNPVSLRSFPVPNPTQRQPECEPCSVTKRTSKGDLEATSLRLESDRTDACLRLKRDRRSDRLACLGVAFSLALRARMLEGGDIPSRLATNMVDNDPKRD